MVEDMSEDEMVEAMIGEVTADQRRAAGRQSQRERKPVGTDTM